jgi:hypothetical protein
VTAVAISGVPISGPSFVEINGPFAEPGRAVL